MKKTSKQHNNKVRASVLRRTIVGSLVVMLSPFLTILEHDDVSAKVTSDPMTHSVRAMEIYERSKAIQQEVHPEQNEADVSPVDTYSFIVIEEALRQESLGFWEYPNMRESFRPE